MGMIPRVALLCGLVSGIAVVLGGEPVVQAPPLPEDKIAAKVNGEAIYERILSDGLPEDAFGSTLMSLKAKKLKREVLIVMMRQFFDTQQIKVSEETVEQTIAEQRKTPPPAACACCRFGSLDEFLAVNYFSWAEYRRVIWSKKALEQYLEREWKKAYPDAAALSALAKQERAAVVAQYVKTWHIFFNTTPPNVPAPDQPDGEKIKARAQTAWQQLQSGKPFADLAKELSDDKITRDCGGYFGYISRERSPFGREATAVLAALQNGAYSQPVASPWGWHIFKGEALTDDDVVAVRKEGFFAAKQEDVRNSVRNSAKVEYFAPYTQPFR